MLLINFSLLAVLLVYYKYGYRWAGLMGLVISFWILIFIFRGLNPWTCIAVASSINIAVFIPYKFDKKESSKFESLNQERDTAYRNTGRLFDELKKIKEEKDLLEKQSLAIIDLYEAARRMTLSSTFPELFKILLEILDRHFIFRNFRLILINQESNIEKILAKDNSEIAASLAEGAFLKLALNIKKPAYFSERKLRMRRGEFKDLPNNIFSLALIPVTFQNKISALIALENINESDYEKLLIFTSQFELALRKIKLYEQVQELAITDGLTQVYVRRHFEQRLQEEKERSLTNNMKMAVLLIDLDHFKEINDRYGHLVGDVVLKELSQIVKNSVRETDLVGRWGGEELIVLLVESDMNLARLVAERIRQLIEKNTFKAYDETVKLTISIGVALFPDEARSISPLLEQADKALYQAKALGRNKIFTFFQEKP